MKESEKKDKYLDFTREEKKLWKKKLMVIQIVIGAFVTVAKGLVQRRGNLEIRGRVETFQTTTLLRSARILRRVLETRGDLLSRKLHEKPSAKTDVENSQGVNDITDNKKQK